MTPSLATITPEEDDGDAHPTIPPGLVPADWPEHRHIGTATHSGRFADIGHSDSLAHLRTSSRRASCTTPR